MKSFVDINPGAVADNFLRALRNCDPKVLNRLARNDMLHINDTFPALNDRSIRYDGLEAYVQASKMPLCYFFFGTHEPPVPSYTPYDNFVIAQLDRMSQAELTAFKECLRLFFPNPFYDLAETDYRKRALATMKHHIPNLKLQGREEFHAFKKLDMDRLREFLIRYEKRNYAWIKLDTMIDLSTYLGVSLHWMLNLKTYPLFCKTLLAEEVFSYYTLLPEQQWEQFLVLLWQCINVDYVHDYMISL